MMVVVEEKERFDTDTGTDTDKKERERERIDTDTGNDKKGKNYPDTPDTVVGIIDSYSIKDSETFKDSESDKDSDKYSDEDSIVTVIETRNRDSISTVIEGSSNDNNNNNNKTMTMTSSNNNDNKTMTSKSASTGKRFYSTKVNNLSVLPVNSLTVNSLPVASLQKIESLKNRACTEEEFLELYFEIEKTLNILKDINKKGYINDTNLINYPLLKECILNYLLKEKKTKTKSEYIKGINVYLDNQIITIEDAKEFYK